MNLDLTRRAVAGVLAFASVSLALLVYMLGQLGALSLPGRHTVLVRTILANAEGLPAAADVLVHGVRVGSVSGLASRRGGTLVTLTLGSGAPRLHAGASVEVGSKTPLGEPFVSLDPGAGPSLRPGELIRARSAVQIDDALSWLDAGGRANLRVVLRALGTGAAPSATSGELNRTLAALGVTTEAVNRLAASLRSQREDLTGIVQYGRSVLTTLAGRTDQLHGLVSDARTTLSALEEQHSALRGTLTRLPGLLSSSDATLAAVRPLIARATPLADQLAAAAPQLTAALHSLPAATDSLRVVLARAGAISASVPPLLHELGALAQPARGALAILGPVLADIVPAVRYLAPRGRTIAAWFANTAALGSHGDAQGDWARFFVMFDPATLLGLRSGAPPGNSYTAPGDAARNAPYVPGDYPRLLPYAPALSQH